FLAAQTGLTIIPTGIGYASAWRVKSWDRFAIPKPFSSIRGVAGEPLKVPPTSDREELNHYLGLLQQRLATATRQAEEWVLGRPRKPPPPQSVPLARAA